MNVESTPLEGGIRFTRRVHAPVSAQARSEAAALVRPHGPGASHLMGGVSRKTTPEPVVRVTPEMFHDILQVSADPIVIREARGWLLRRMHFTTQYQGYYFTTRIEDSALRMPPGAMVIDAERVDFR